MRKKGIILLVCLLLCMLLSCKKENDPSTASETSDLSAATETGAITVTAAPNQNSTSDQTEAKSDPQQSWRVLTSSNYSGSDSYTTVDGIIYSFAVTSGNNVKLEAYDPAVDQWTMKNNPSVKRFMYSVINLNGKIYLLGGAVDYNLKTTNAVEVYDPAKDEWTIKAPMNTARLGSAFAVTIGNKIYCVGQGIIEEYDPAADTWNISKSGLMERDGYGIAVLNNKLYIVGGKTKDASKALSDVEEYDPATGTLTKKAELVSPVCFPCLRVYNNKIYLLLGTDEGGVNGTDTVQSYDPATDQWELKSPFPFPRADVQVTEAGGKFYTIGGWYNNLFVDDVVEYDPLKDVWTVKASLPSVRNYFCAVGLSGNIYVFGGKIDYNTNINSLWVFESNEAN